MASYVAPSGHYADDQGVLSARKPVTNGPLTATAGVYTYGSGVPVSTWNESNYYVDVLFVAGTATTSSTTTTRASTSTTTTTPVIDDDHDDAAVIDDDHDSVVDVDDHGVVGCVWVGVGVVEFGWVWLAGAGFDGVCGWSGVWSGGVGWVDDHAGRDGG